MNTKSLAATTATIAMLLTTPLYSDPEILPASDPRIPGELKELAEQIRTAGTAGDNSKFLTLLKSLTPDMPTLRALFRIGESDMERIVSFNVEKTAALSKQLGSNAPFGSSKPSIIKFSVATTEDLSRLDYDADIVNLAKRGIIRENSKFYTVMLCEPGETTGASIEHFISRDGKKWMLLDKDIELAMRNPDQVKFQYADADNLRKIGRALEQYANDHEDQVPENLQILLTAGLLQKDALMSPLANDRTEIAFELLLPGKNLARIERMTTTPIVRSRFKTKDGYSNVLFADFHVETEKPSVLPLK